jgi:uncharacterized protein YdeI (YjbR/CyaY-like superfamily)
METPRYIKSIEDKNGILSIMTLNSIQDKVIEFLDKKITRVWERGVFNTSNQIIWEEVIYKTNQGFFIYVKKNDDNIITLTIYYKSEQLNELKIFINQTNKQLRN